jgi:hypothetical protein
VGAGVVLLTVGANHEIKFKVLVESISLSLKQLKGGESPIGEGEEGVDVLSSYYFHFT